MNSMNYGKNKVVGCDSTMKAMKEEIPVDGLLLEMREITQRKDIMLNSLRFTTLPAFDEAIEYLERHI